MKLKNILMLFLVVFVTVVGGCGKNSIVTENNTKGDITAEMTDDQIVEAIKNYCYANNPDLEAMVSEGKYQIYWEIESGDDKETVVLYRSYTSAEVRYYISRDSGDTYVTEFMPGITPEEVKTDESFNVKDYLSQD